MILKNAKINDEILDLEIKGSRIVEISKEISGDDEIDCSGLTLAPAFVEMHCHLREPGDEVKETIETGARSAIKGGYGAICPMPNTKPANDNSETLRFILDRTKVQGIGVFPICALTKGLDSIELTDIVGLSKSGAIAFSDDGKPFSNLKVLEAALKIARANDLLVISHAEDTRFSPYDNRSEFEAVKAEIELVKKIGSRYHFAHISTKESVELIRQAKLSGVLVTCETAPHYFSLTHQDANNEARFKMNPPLRTQVDLEAIIEGLKDGTIDVIATDHAPHTIEEKNLDFDSAPMGIVGFETAFSLCFSNLVLKKHLSLNQLIEKLSVNPAKILRLNDYGRIEVGGVANLVLIDENAQVVVDASKFESKCKISPFDKMELKGKIISTVIEGKIYGD